MQVSLPRPEAYPVLIFWSAADAAFIVEVPDLPGCMADGATQELALANARVVIAEWQETARELGRPIPLPRPALRLAA
jgi:predicted RNase H-like HicB family nuclease